MVVVIVMFVVVRHFKICVFVRSSLGVGFVVVFVINLVMLQAWLYLFLLGVE